MLETSLLLAEMRVRVLSMQLKLPITGFELRISVAGSDAN